IITNALPASAFAATDNTLAFFDGLLNHEDPQTFEQMFAKVSANQVVLVSGEEDNEYVPGGGGGGGEENWGGMEESGTVANSEDQHFETPTLAPGSYRFDLSGNNDADLYVRIGQAPTLESYDCRPYRYGSKESCRVDLSTAAPIHVMVRGWASSSDYVMKGVTEQPAAHQPQGNSRLQVAPPPARRSLPPRSK
ncbi:MAG: hypothetical protein GY953_47980, partial [bacterium]|nr:hypothetical protein [bacterium]